MKLLINEMRRDYREIRNNFDPTADDVIVMVLLIGIGVIVIGLGAIVR